MANQATSSQVPSTARGTAPNTAPTHTSNAGRKRRSCLMCSKRKVKCDKQKPCICCVKAGIECIFPVMTANRSEAGCTPELVEMLQRLERAVKTLDSRGSDNSVSTLPPSHNSLPSDDNHIDLRQPSGPTTEVEGPTTKTRAQISEHESTAPVHSTNRGEKEKGKASSVASSHAESPGRIVRDHGRDMYVRRWFWDDESTEVSNGQGSCPRLF